MKTMQRIDANTIAISEEELSSLREFIDQSLDSRWDHYTDNIISRTPWEEGKRQMNPEMYDMMKQMYNV
jgi:hypothetical protein